MKHLFIPYELAVIAKEKGFDEPCISLYTLKGEFIHSEDGWMKHNSQGFNNYSAPLYQQIVDFFREKHSIAIEPLTWVEVTTWMVRNRNTNETKYTCVEKDYYVGINKAIEEAFKLI